MQVSETAVVVLADEILFTELAPCQFVILAPESGNYFELQETGGFLWSLWRDDGSVARSIDRLVERYQVERATAAQDVLELISDLAQRGLVEVSNPS